MLNWNAAGALAEIIGAAAVVISVVYLAVQVKKQTQEARLAATRDLSDQGNQVLDRISSDLTLVATYGRAVQDYKSLPTAERLWTSLIFQRACRVMEQQLLHTKKGNVDPVYFESFQNAFLEFLTFPGAQEWWQDSSSLFSADFRRYVDEQMIDAKAKGYSSTFKSETNNPATISK